MTDQPTLVDEGLFEEPPRMVLARGETVIVQTILGEETCIILDVTLEHGYPVARLRTDGGDEISVSIARVKRPA